MVINQFPARFGKYILLDRINAGGMAEVFRAKVTGAEKFERLVAIKCMLPQLLEDAHFKNMFIDEAKLAAQLTHANIVQIYELGELKRTDQQFLYIAMELVSGRDLRHILRTARANLTPIPVGLAAYVISKAAAGLDFAHRKVGVDGHPLNLVHRDVSPQNILVSYDGEVKVVDFGIAKAEARHTETQAGVLKGKFAYMAPEQVTGSAIDRRADIFALGTVLYEVITGQRLFTGDNDLSVLEKVRAAKLPDLRSMLPEGGEELEHVLRRALARKPDDRYTYGSEMAEDLEHLLIEDRSIFGYKRAAQFMQTLYADEVAHLTEQMRRYSEVTTQNCVVTIDDEAVREGDFVFGSTFVDQTSDDTPVHGQTRQTDSPNREDMQDSPSVVRRRARAAPVTGVHTRRVRRLVSSPSAGHTAVAPNPMPTHASQVVRNVWVALMLATFVVATLVILVSMKMPISGNALPSNPTVQRLADEMKAYVSNQTKEMNNNFPTHLEPAPPLPAPTPATEPDDNDGDPHGRYGWVWVRFANDHGRVFIDQKEVGPLPQPPKKLRVGQHEVKILDEAGVLRGKVTSVVVTSRNTRKSPKVVSP